MNTYTVTVDNYNAHIGEAETVTVQGASASYDRDALTIWADAEGNRVAAVFRRWEHVTIDRPDRDCTSPDCLKHNGYRSPTGEANPEDDWKAVAAEVLALPTSAISASAVLAIRQLARALAAEALSDGTSGT